ncbi:MAG: ferredoxin reductase [Solirubrobacterales bacterium]|nr:ferredoxin reductase [Solirubrobacterales bacterium]
MAERGAQPNVPQYRRRALKAVESFFSPLLPDDYLELINPLWSTQELRGRIERIHPEADGAVTVVIKPGYKWGGHQAGQYLRIGVVVDGIHHWRAYSLTSDADRPDGCITITPKLVDSGKVSPWLTGSAKPGDIVRLGGVEGTFTLPDRVPPRLLFITAGSGITPIMSMIRSIDRSRAYCDIVHIHSARDADRVIFGEELRRLAADRTWLDLHIQETSKAGRIAPPHLDNLCPDWQERQTLHPAREMLDDPAHWEAEGLAGQLVVERFQPVIGGNAGEGTGGTITFKKSKVTAEAEAGTPILVAGEEAGIEMPFGCRMGICHTCVGQLCSGQLRDLRTGEIHGAEGEMVRTCVNAPEGPVEIKL